LLQYVPTATYYARVKVRGKLVRQRLKTTAYTTALLRLGDFLKAQRSKLPRNENAPIAFADARRLFEADLETRHDMQPRAKEYRHGCIKVLLKTWPGLDGMRLTGVTETPCQESGPIGSSKRATTSITSTKRFPPSATSLIAATLIPTRPEK
jgi:hypothetical protein